MADTKELELRQCAAAWEPGVRLLGNVTAQEIVEVCDTLTEARDYWAEETTERQRLESEVADLRAQLAAALTRAETAERDAATWKGYHSVECDRTLDALEKQRAAERELDAARAECEDLESRLQDSDDAETARLREELQAYAAERLEFADMYRAEQRAHAETNAMLNECRNDARPKLAELEAARQVLEACEALVISTDAVGPLSMNGKPQICSSTTALAAAEWARRAAKETES